MESKVQLSRSGDEPWGFRLIGGADFEVPLTVVKVIPNSSAEKAGLQNGDNVSSINGMTTKYMTHDDSRKALAEAKDSLVLGVSRGYYDPVLDDWEPYYEEIDLDDSDQPSRPTEVFSPQQFTDIPALGLSNDPTLVGSSLGQPYDPNVGRSPFGQPQSGTPIDQLGSRGATVTPYDSKLGSLSRGTTPFNQRLGTPGRELESDGRSLTASPFILPTKPYRPFSTEPVNKIPPLEDPIILNSSYKDVFPDFGINEDLLPKTRFKLPISEQYDPDGTRSKVRTQCKIETNITESITETNHETQSSCSTAVQLKTEIKEEMKIESYKSELKEETKTEEITFADDIKQEVDIKKIDIAVTASNIVDESIQKAVTVADDIKKEIDVELYKTDTEIVDKNVIVEQKIAKNNKNDKSIEEIFKQTDIKEVNKDVTQKHEHVKVCKKIEALKDSHKKSDKSIEERKESIKQEIEDIVESGSVKQKSVIFEKKGDTLSEKQVQKSADVSKVKETTTYKERKKEIQQKDSRTEKSDTKQSTEIKTEKASTSRLLAEQRAYIIGLQTIPNIRGSIHSTHHYNLLLKTFFIHLTDVMVALSRFILAEPVFNKEGSTTTTERTETIDNERKSTTESVVKKENFVTKNEQQELKQDKVIVESTPQEPMLPTKIKETQIIAKTESITQDISDHMHKETKHEASVIEKIKEQVKKEALETMHTENGVVEINQTISQHKVSGSKMAQRVEKKSEDLIQSMDSVIHEFQTKAAIEETSTATLETKESDEISENHTKSKGKNTYVAVVESHTYTNKDAILAEFLTGQSTLQSPEEKKTIQSVDAINNSTKATESSRAIELAKAVIEAAAEQIVEIQEEVQISEQNLHEYLAMQTSNATVEESHKIEDYKQVKEKVAEVHEEVQIADQSCTGYSKIIQTSNETAQETFQIEDYKQTEDFLATEREEKLEYEKLHKEVIAEVKKELEAVEEQKSEPIMVEECEVVTLKRPQTLDLKLHEDPHIVKKKLEIDFSETIHSQFVSEGTSFQKNEEKTENQKVVMHEDPHIVKKKLELEKETSVETSKTELNQDTIAISESKESTSTMQSETVESKVFISQGQSSFQSSQQQQVTSVEQKHVEQESSFVARNVQNTHELSLNTQINQETLQFQQTIAQSIKTEDTVKQMNETQPELAKPIENGIEAPTVPPTPLTDEYLFKLNIPFPRGVTPVPPDPSPEAEPLSGKDLVPHIDTKLDSPILYDPPLPTPPGSKVTSPVYTKPGLNGGLSGRKIRPVYIKPGLRGGADRPEYTKEEIMEIELKSSLLASAIDETIKSIEEYKEEVGLKKAAREETDVNVEVKIATSYDSKTASQQWCIVDQKVTNITNGDVPMTNGIKEEDNLPKIDADMKENNSNNTEPNATEQIRNNVETNSEDNTTSIDLETIKSEVAKLITSELKEKGNPLERYRPVKFDLEEIQNIKLNLRNANTNGMQVPPVTPTKEMFKSETGEPLGTHQGIVDGLEDAVVEPEVANELGKPGMTEEKIAELISGEAEMLREAHVMGLSRVIKSHMHRYPDDSSVDFKKIKPIINSLKDSEVLKALNDEVLEEMMREKEKKKKEEKTSWTTFLQKPQRPVPKAKFGYHGYVETKEEVKKPYKVQIVKQPKPKVAPDFKPKDFNTGLLPWEERALREPTPPPVEREEPLLVPEEPPEILEAVDPLPESEVPDLEDSGIPLPEPEPEKELEEETSEANQDQEVEEEELDLEAIVEETEKIVEDNLVEEMEQNNLAEQLISNVQSMVDPNAPLEQQLAQMRAQIAALAQLPCVIQQSLDIVTKQLSQLTSKEVKQSTESTEVETTHSEVTETETEETMPQEIAEEEKGEEVATEATAEVTEEPQQSEEVTAQETVTAEVMERMRREEEEMLEEQKRIEKQKKELMEQTRREQEGRQLKQRPTPRVGKPKPVFGPVEPQERPLILPGGRKWRNPKDVYTEEMFKEALQAQMESINGMTMGINFMKYEKPPVSLDHIKESETYKMIHNMEQAPGKRVDMLTPVMAECDYREVGTVRATEKSIN